MVSKYQVQAALAKIAGAGTARGALREGASGDSRRHHGSAARFPLAPRNSSMIPMPMGAQQAAPAPPANPMPLASATVPMPKTAADKPDVAKLVGELFAARQTIHALHLKSKDYAEHVALNEFYESILDQIDSFVETYQGQYGLLDQAGTLEVETDADPTAYLKKLCGLIRKTRAAMGEDDTHLQNALDEMLSTAYHVIYKLTFLGGKKSAAFDAGREIAARMLAKQAEAKGKDEYEYAGLNTPARAPIGTLKGKLNFLVGRQKKQAPPKEEKVALWQRWEKQAGALDAMPTSPSPLGRSRGVQSNMLQRSQAAAGRVAAPRPALPAPPVGLAQAQGAAGFRGSLGKGGSKGPTDVCKTLDATEPVKKDITIQKHASLWRAWEKKAAYAEDDTGPFSGQMAANVSGADKFLGALTRARKTHPYHYLLNPFAPGPLTEGATRLQKRYDTSLGSGYPSALANIAAGGIGGAVQGGTGLPVADLITAPVRIGSMIHGGKKLQRKAHLAHRAVNEPWKRGGEQPDDYEALVRAATRAPRTAADMDARKDQIERAKEKSAAEGGPVDLPLAGTVAGLDDVIAGMRRNRHEHPFHYALNPYVAGPVREMASRYARRVAAGAHGSWAGQAAAIPSLGIVPALMGGAKAKDRARGHFERQVRDFDAQVPGTDASRNNRETLRALWPGLHEQQGPLQGLDEQDIIGAANGNSDPTVDAAIAASKTQQHPSQEKPVPGKNAPADWSSDDEDEYQAEWGSGPAGLPKSEEHKDKAQSKAAAFGAKLAALVEPDFDRQAKITLAIRQNAKRRKAKPKPQAITAMTADSVLKAACVAAALAFPFV